MYTRREVSKKPTNPEKVSRPIVKVEDRDEVYRAQHRSIRRKGVK